MKELEPFEDPATRGGVSASRVVLVVLLGVLAVALGSAVWYKWVATKESPERPRLAYVPGQCDGVLPRSLLDESLVLGTEYLLRNQRPEGNFRYAVDAVTDRAVNKDYSVHQAGAAWRLAMIHAVEPELDGARPRLDLAEAMRKTIEFFDTRSRRTIFGGRYVRYPGERKGRIGVVALVLLAHLERLRGASDDTPIGQMSETTDHIHEYVKFILGSRQDDGQFHEYYDIENGDRYGDPDPYDEGQILLALTEAATELKSRELQETALEIAELGYQKYVEEVQPDTDTRLAKRYYPWAGLAYFELATEKWGDAEKYGQRLLDMADWFVDTHKPLDRSENTAYAYHVMVPAYRIALSPADLPHVEKFDCSIQSGIKRLLSWQHGGPLESASVTSQDTVNLSAHGGVVRGDEDSTLRLDATQDHLHAIALARLHYLTQ